MANPAAAAAFAIRQPLPIACATPRAERHGQSGGERRRDDGLPLPFLDSPCSRARARVQVHSLFSFMNMAQAWITFGGELKGVITDRALIEAGLLAADGK